MEQKCNETAVFRYTWPGRDEAFVCYEHAFKLKAVAKAMGLNLQIIEIPVIQDDSKCEQIVSK